MHKTTSQIARGLNFWATEYKAVTEYTQQLGHVASITIAVVGKA